MKTFTPDGHHPLCSIEPCDHFHCDTFKIFGVALYSSKDLDRLNDDWSVRVEEDPHRRSQ